VTTTPCPVCEGGGCQACGQLGAVPPGVTHIAGVVIGVTPLVRQLCSWCGERLVDVDESRTSRPLLPDGSVDETPYPTWPIGAMVLHDGAVWTVVDFDPEVDKLPANSCARNP
jgi:hypothetical protein